MFKVAVCFFIEHVFLGEEEGRAVSHAIAMFSRAPPLVVITWLVVKAIRVCLFFPNKLYVIFPLPKPVAF